MADWDVVSQTPATTSAPKDQWSIVSQAPAPSAAPDEWTPVAQTPINPDDKPGILSTFGKATLHGIGQGFTQAGQSVSAFKDRPVDENPDLYQRQLEKTPIHEGWTDPNWWAQRIGSGLGESSPTLGLGVVGGVAGSTLGPVGTVAGSAGGFALGSALQTVAPAYQRARAEGLDHDAAVKRAVEETGIASAFGAAMGLAPELKLFGKSAEDAILHPIGEALAQIFAVQPTIGAGQQVATGALEGKLPTAEELAEGYATNAGLGAGMVGAHKALETVLARPGAPAPGGGPREPGAVPEPEAGPSEPPGGPETPPDEWKPVAETPIGVPPKEAGPSAAPYEGPKTPVPDDAALPGGSPGEPIEDFIRRYADAGFNPQQIQFFAKLHTGEKPSLQDIKDTLATPKGEEPAQLDDDIPDDWKPVAEAAPADDESQFQREDEPAPVFFSALAKGLENVKQQKAPAGQWAGIIDNLPGVKKDEVDWTGVKDWLADQQGPVSKDDLLQHIAENGVQLQEITKEASPEYQAVKNQIEAEITRYKDLKWKWMDATSEDKQELINQINSSNDKIKQLQTIASAIADKGIPTKYSDYTSPGGTNYREMLLTLPGKKIDDVDAAAWAKEMVVASGEFWDWLTPEQQAAWIERGKDQSLKGNISGFQSAHWDEPNVLAHIRFDDRSGPNGEKILHLNEIQSDWHQKGRQQGYQSSEPETVYRIKNRVSGNTSDWYNTAEEAHVAREALPENIRANIVVEDRVLPQEGVPNAPFKTSWQELAMKRMLRYAAEHGYDKVTWDTGATQVDRYSLARQIRALRLHDNSSGGIGGPKMEGPFTGGTLTAFGHNMEKLIDRYVKTPEELAGLIGKEAAQKLLDSPARPTSHAGIGVRERSLHGLDLKIGGEGMKGFYDKILPEFVNKYTKKWGTKVNDNEVNPNTGKWEVFDTKDGATKAFYDTEEEAKAHVSDEDKIGYTGLDYDQVKDSQNPVHSLEVTPKMRESVMQGQPMFQRDLTPGGNFRDAHGAIWEALSKNVVGAGPSTPELWAKHELAIAHQINSLIRKMNPDVKVGAYRRLLGVLPDDSITNISGEHHIDAATMASVINWSLRSSDPVHTAGHEIIHSLRRSGAITPEEWGTLAQAAKDENWHDQHNINKRYNWASDDLKTEEAVADHFGAWLSGQLKEAPSTAVEKIFQKLAQFRDAVYAATKKLLGREPTAQDIFGQIAKGDIGARGSPRLEAMRNPEVQYQIASGRPAPAEAFQPETAEDKLAKIAATGQPKDMDLLVDQGNMLGSGSQFSKTPPGVPPTVPHNADFVQDPKQLPRDANWFERNLAVFRAIGQLFPDGAKVYGALDAKTQYEGTLLRQFSGAVKDFTQLKATDRQAVLDMLYDVQHARQGNANAKPRDLPDGSKWFNGHQLTPEQAKGYTAAVGMTRQVLNELKKVQMERNGLNPALTSANVHTSPIFRSLSKGVQASLKDFLRSWEGMSKGDYFPVMRFGDKWFIEGKDQTTGNTVFRQQFDTALDPKTQQAFISAARAKHGLGADVEFNTGKIVPGVADESLGVPELMSLDRLAQAMGNVNHNEWNQIFNAMLDKMRAEGPGAHLLQRQMTPGYDHTDGKRIAATYVLGMSRMLSNMAHAEKIFDAVKNVDKNQPKLQTLLQKHVDYAMNPAEQLSRVKSFLALQDIGLSLPVAYKHILNLPIRGFPLAMSYGIHPVLIAKHLSAGLADATKYLSANGKGMDPRMVKLFQEGESKGFLGSRFTDDLYAQSNTPSGSKSQTLQNILNGAGVFVRQAEKMGRMSMYSMGYRAFHDTNVQNAILKAAKTDPLLQDMIHQRGFTPEMLGEFLSRESFFDYGRANTPPIMQGKIPGLLGLFQKVQSNMMSSFYVLGRKVFQGNKQAAAQLGMMMLAGGLINGVFGVLPAGHFIKDLGEEAASMMGVPHPDVERAMKEQLAQLGVGHDWIDRINRGLMANLAGFDLHTQSGLELPYTSQLSAVLGLGGKKPADVLGAAGSYVENMLGAMQTAISGNPQWKATTLQALLPVAAQRFYRWMWDVPENGLRTQTGHTVLTPEQIKNGDKDFNLQPVTKEERLMAAMGFPPSSVQEYQNRVTDEFKATSRLTKMTTAYANRGIEALNDMTSDAASPSAKAQAATDFTRMIQEFIDYNQKALANGHPEDIITPGSLQSAMKSGIMGTEEPQWAKIKRVPKQQRETAMRLLQGLNW